MLLNNLNTILVNTRFPENIGMAARACANMGCPSLRLVAPQRWNLHAAEKLATPKGLPILQNMEIFPNLSDAVADCHYVYGSTARSGGWRKALSSPAQAGDEIALLLKQDNKVALVFGPEDRGLDNREIVLCGQLVHIRVPTAASSLNLAQAVLLILYECAKAAMRENMPVSAAGASKNHQNFCRITVGELAHLETTFKGVLERLHCLQGKNPDYHFIQWHNILARAALRRHEFDALMGLCRQLENRLGKSPKDSEDTDF